MANILIGFFAWYSASDEIVKLSKGFSNLLATHDESGRDFESMQFALRQFRDDVRAAFRPIGKIESIHDKNSYNGMWDYWRARAMRDWMDRVGERLCNPRKVFPFDSYLKTIAHAAEATERGHAPASNWALTQTYANLLCISTHPQHNTPGIARGLRPLECYVGHLQIVWNTAARYHGHQEAMRTELEQQLAINDKWDFWTGGCHSPESTEIRKEILAIIRPK